MDYNVKSINTIYKNQLFKSKLEAKWAAMFDLFGWEWAYEPVKIGSKIPDFIIKGKKADIIVEVKPRIYITLEWVIGLFNSYYMKGIPLLILHDSPFEVSDSFGGDYAMLGIGWGQMVDDYRSECYLDIEEGSGNISNSKLSVPIHSYEMKYEPFDFACYGTKWDGLVFDFCKTRKNFIDVNKKEYQQLIAMWIYADHITGIGRFYKN